MKNTLIIALIISLGLTGAYIIHTQNQQKEVLNEILAREKKLTTLSPATTPTPTPSTSNLPLSTTTPSPSSTPSTFNLQPSTTITPTPTRPPIVFIDEGSFPAEDKAELISRWVDPFVDYSKMQLPDRHLSSITFKKSPAPYAYIFDAVFNDGVTQGSVISKKDGHIEWWSPECMGPCPFPPGFEAQYPEVVKKAKGV